MEVFFCGYPFRSQQETTHLGGSISYFEANPREVPFLDQIGGGDPIAGSGLHEEVRQLQHMRVSKAGALAQCAPKLSGHQGL